MFKKFISSGLSVDTKIGAMLGYTHAFHHDAIPLLLKKKTNGNWAIKACVADAIGWIQPQPKLGDTYEDCVSALLPFVKNKNWAIRNSGAWALARMGAKDAVLPMIKAMRSEKTRDILPYLQVLTQRRNVQEYDHWMNWWHTQKMETFRTGKQMLDHTSILEFYRVKDLTKNVIFVIDVSGSMNEPQESYTYGQEGNRREVPTRLRIAQNELQKVVKTLHHETRFNIIYFSHEFFKWKEQPVQATHSYIQLALDDIERRTAIGGTEGLIAIEMGMQQIGAETIFFLTDGDLQSRIRNNISTQSLTTYNQNNERPTRIHAVVILDQKRNNSSAPVQIVTDNNGGQMQEVE